MQVSYSTKQSVKVQKFTSSPVKDPAAVNKFTLSVYDFEALHNVGLRHCGISKHISS